MRRIHCAAGLTIVELVVSLAVTLVAMACVFESVSSARRAFAVQPESSDLQQRIRVGVEALMKQLLMAGAGMTLDDGAPESHVAPIAPYRIGDVDSDAGAGRYYRPDVVSIAYTLPRSTAADSSLVRHTYYLKSTGGDVFQLMHYDGRQTDFPVLDDVVRLGFDYFGDPRPPELIRAGDAEAELRPRVTYGPRPPDLNQDDPADAWGPGENCTWAAIDGQHRSKLSSLSEAPTPVRLDPAILTDGPWCPEAAHSDRFDADLLRIRRVRVQIRFQAPRAFRGPQGLLFMRGGTAPAAWSTGSGSAVRRGAPEHAMKSQVASRKLQVRYNLLTRPDLRLVTSSAERGNSLLVVLMATTLLMGLGGGLVLLTNTEVHISTNFSGALEGLYAADGAIERVMPDLLATPDWNAVLAGTVRSSFVDGPPQGVRTLGDGTTLRFAEATNTERCGRPAACSDADMDAVTAERPQGANNPRWQLFAYGPVKDFLPDGRAQSRVYVVVWVGDDALENDGDPLADGSTPLNPGRGALAVRARAYGPRGVRRGVEALVLRDQSGLRRLSWREL